VGNRKHGRATKTLQPHLGGPRMMQTLLCSVNLSFYHFPHVLMSGQDTHCAEDISEAGEALVVCFFKRTDIFTSPVS
jgi:hypothetical protein